MLENIGSNMELLGCQTW